MRPLFCFADTARVIAALALTLVVPSSVYAQCGDRQITCVDDIVVTECGTHGAVINYTAPTASDSCGPVATYLVEGYAPGSVFPFGTTTVEWRTGYDDNDHFERCIFTVTVLVSPRTLVCPGDTVIVACGNFGPVVNYPQPVAYDSCGPVPTYLYEGLPPGSNFPFFTTTVEWQTDYDGNENIESCTFHVTVQASRRTIECPDDIVVTGCSSEGAVVNYLQPTAYDMCGPVPTYLYQGLPSGSVFPYGTTIVEWQTDYDGQERIENCDFTVTVLEDTEPPAITCLTGVTAVASDGGTSAVVNYDVEVTDGCPDGLVVSYQPPSGTTLPCGITPVTVTARDAGGRESTCRFNATVSLPVPVDILPAACPNPLNVATKGVVPVAIMGSSLFDVARIDPASVRLEGVAPAGWSRTDVGAPFLPMLGKGDCRDCSASRKDKRGDVLFRFDQTAVVAALGPVADGACRTLRLTGATRDGCPIFGEDVVRLQVGGTIPAGDGASVTLVPVTAPRAPVLHAARPNPLAQATAIEFELPTAATVRLEVFDVVGRPVRLLLNEPRTAGRQAAAWDGADDAGRPVADGVYFYQLTVVEGTPFREVRKLVVSR
ncbi:MAG TPA: HYR domain-containing protein [Candidatus Eisenbacteria bacterium]